MEGLDPNGTSSRREEVDETNYGLTKEDVHKITLARSAYSAEYAKASDSLLELDPLTGVQSRIFLERKLNEALKSISSNYNEKRKTSENEHTLSILFSDLNKFKQVNDTRGHEVGDEVLKRAAHILTANIRSKDVVARLGGDEFVILLSATDHDGAEKVKEKIKKAFVDDSYLSNLGVTISVGICSVDGASGVDAEAVLKEADKAMYIDKRNSEQ